MDRLFFSNDEFDKEIFRYEVSETLNALDKAFDTDECYKGAHPDEVKKDITSIDMLPVKGIGFDEALEVIEKKVFPHMVFPPSKTYMAHLHSPALVEGICSELIIGAFNQSMDSWDQGPAATNVELEVVNTLCKLYGFKNGDGAITSGGSQSNLTALFLARDNKLLSLGFDARNNPLGEWSEKLVCYTSEISHFSSDKAMHLMGLSYKNLRHIKVDDTFSMDAKELEKTIKEDIKNGFVPFCIVATVGTTDFGSIDPLEEITQIAKKYSILVHADAAYGSALIMSNEYKTRLKGIEKVDSITVDFHKMFLLPISCSAILVRNNSYLDPLSFHAVYLNREEDEEEGYDNLVSKGLQTTRRFDALKVLFSFMARGRDGFDAIVSKSLKNAEYFYTTLKNHPDFEVLTPPMISAVIFRVVNPKANEDLLNKKVRHVLMHEKGTFIGETVVNSKVFLKTTLLNPKLDKKDLDSLIEEMHKIAFS